MHILIINAGSSSVKFTLFYRDGLRRLADGMVERIGLSDTTVHYQNGAGGRFFRKRPVADAREAVGLIADMLMDADGGVIHSKAQVGAIGHRVVHGGEYVQDAALIDAHLIGIVRDCFDLAPLHNPPNLKGIEACQAIFPGIPQVAVFDTAFHATLPAHAYLYGLPYDYYRNAKIRRYGFHGTSHRYVSRKAADLIGQPVSSLKLVTCHLGNGCSVAAVCHGRSVDTSMGFTPLEGLIMGTRCGDIDPAIVLHLMRTNAMDAEQVSTLLNEESGMKGLAGVGSGDFRDIVQAAAAGNRQAQTAIDVCAYRIKKYIGAYAFAMGGIDAVVFTAGVGENSDLLRRLICQGLEQLGIVLDPEKNAAGNRTCCFIHAVQSRVRLLVVPTDEARAIALQTIELLGSGSWSGSPA